MWATKLCRYVDPSLLTTACALLLALGATWPQTALAQATTCGQSGYYPDICEPDCFEAPATSSSVSFDPTANDYNETGSPVVLDGSSLASYPELSLQNGLVTYTPTSPPGALPYLFAYRTQHGGLGSAEVRLAGLNTSCDVDNPGQPPAPPAPTGLSATPTATPSLRLTWNASAGPPAAYRLFRAVAATPNTFVPYPDFPGSTTSFEDFDVTRGATYRYQIQSIATDGTPSAMSAPLTVQVPTEVAVTVTWGTPTGPAITNGYIAGSPQFVPIGYQWTSCTPATNAYCEYRLYVHNPTNTALTVTNVTNPTVAGVEIDNTFPFQVTQQVNTIQPNNHAELVIRLNALREDQNNAFTWVRMRFNNGQLPDFTFQLRVYRDTGMPVIDAHPLPITVIRGMPATFSVTAHHTGSRPMVYVWARNTVNPPSAPDGTGPYIAGDDACFTGRRFVGQGTTTLTVHTSAVCPPPTIPNSGPYNDFFVRVATACSPNEQGCTEEFGRSDVVFSRRAALDIVDLSFPASGLPAALTHVPNDRSVQLIATANVAPLRPLTYTWLILDVGGQTHDCAVEQTYCTQWGLSDWNTNTVRVNLVGTPNAAFAGTLRLRVRAAISPTLSVTTDPVAQPIAIQLYGPDSLPSFADTFFRGAAFKRADREPLHTLAVQQASIPTNWVAAPSQALRIDQTIDALELGEMPTGIDWRDYRHAEIPFAPGADPQIAKSAVEYFDSSVWQAQVWFRSAASVVGANVAVGDELVARIEANNGSNGTRRVILSRKRTDSSWIAFADVPYTTTTSAVPLALEYDPYSARANVWFNGAMVIANVPVSGPRPNIQFAGFSMRARNSATTDSVAVRGFAAGRRTAQPPAMVPMYASDFDVASFGDWSARVDPGLTPLLTQITSPNRLRVAASANTNAWLADRSPVSAHRYIAEFELDTSSLSTLNASDVPVLYTLNDLSGTGLLQVQMRGGASISVMDLRVRVNAGSGFFASNWIRDVTRARQRLRVELVSPELGSATPGSVIGTLSVSPIAAGLTRTESATTTGPTLQIEEARLGLVAGTRETIAGALIYDTFLAYRPRQ
jgi:hypothetical protein